MQTSVYFSDIFCKSVVDAQVKYEIVPFLKHLRKFPEMGNQIDENKPAFRRWIIKIPGRGKFVLYYVWLKTEWIIDCSMLLPYEAFYTDKPTSDTLRDMMLIAKIAATIKDFLTMVVGD